MKSGAGCTNIQRKGLLRREWGLLQPFDVFAALARGITFVRGASGAKEKTGGDEA